MLEAFQIQFELTSLQTFLKTNRLTSFMGLTLVCPSLPFHLPFSLPFSNWPQFLVPIPSSPICLSYLPLSHLTFPFFSPVFLFNVSPILLSRPFSPLNFTPAISLPDFSSWNYSPLYVFKFVVPFFSPLNFTAAISLSGVSLPQFLSWHPDIPRNIFLNDDDFTFNQQENYLMWLWYSSHFPHTFKSPQLSS